MDELSRFARKRRIWSLCRRRSQHRIWLVAGVPAPRQMPQIGQKPIPTTSSQSPLRVYRPAGEGIPRSAPLLLSSKQNPLRWAFVW